MSGVFIQAVRKELFDAMAAQLAEQRRQWNRALYADGAGIRPVDLPAFEWHNIPEIDPPWEPPDDLS